MHHYRESFLAFLFYFKTESGKWCLSSGLDPFPCWMSVCVNQEPTLLSIGLLDVGVGSSPFCGSKQLSLFVANGFACVSSSWPCYGQQWLHNRNISSETALSHSESSSLNEVGVTSCGFSCVSGLLNNTKPTSRHVIVHLQSAECFMW